jgi:hypothetical protein
MGAAGQAPATGPTFAGIVTVAALILFIACFAFSLGPVTWTVINEVFPARVRGRGVALATAVNWGSAYLVSQILPVACRSHRELSDVLAVRLFLRGRMDLDLPRRA